MGDKKDGMRSCTDLCGPEPAGGAGPAYSVIVVAPSKVTLPSGGMILLGVLSDRGERDAHQ